MVHQVVVYPAPMLGRESGLDAGINGLGGVFTLAEGNGRVNRVIGRVPRLFER